MTVASNYVIELSGEQSGSFVVCQPILVIDKDGNWGGLNATEIAQYIKRHMLPAAPLPGRPLHADDFRPGPGMR